MAASKAKGTRNLQGKETGAECLCPQLPKGARRGLGVPASRSGRQKTSREVPIRWHFDGSPGRLTS